MVDGFQFSVAVGDIRWCVCDTCFVVNWQHNWDKRVSMYKLACLMFIRTDFAVIGTNIYLATCICVQPCPHIRRTSSAHEWNETICTCVCVCVALRSTASIIRFYRRAQEKWENFAIYSIDFAIFHIFRMHFRFAWRQIWIFSLIIISAESPAGTFMMVALLCCCYQCESVARDSCKNTCVRRDSTLETCIWMLKTVERSKTPMTWSGFNPTHTRTTLSLVFGKSMHK